MDNVASRVIAKCGGHAVVSEWTNTHISQVYRWTYPKERGGTGGVVPTSSQHELLAKALAAGIDLTPADFFEAPAKSTSSNRKRAS